MLAIDVFDEAWKSLVGTLSLLSTRHENKARKLVIMKIKEKKTVEGFLS